MDVAPKAVVGVRGETDLGQQRPGAGSREEVATVAGDGERGGGGQGERARSWHGRHGDGERQWWGWRRRPWAARARRAARRASARWTRWWRWRCTRWRAARNRSRRRAGGRGRATPSPSRERGTRKRRQARRSWRRQHWPLPDTRRCPVWGPTAWVADEPIIGRSGVRSPDRDTSPRAPSDRRRRGRSSR